MADNLSDYYLERIGSHGEDFAFIPLRFGANTLGRLPTNNIVLSSKYASRRHCTIYVTEANEVTAKNHVTTNGIFINGVQNLDRDSDILLTVDDNVGIGCDTSNDEIGDAECFIFKIKRNKKDEECEAEEIISLCESDEEEERIQEEYSQMNLSAMKQELMELEDFVEELNSVKADPDVGYNPDIGYVPVVGYAPADGLNPESGYVPDVDAAPRIGSVQDSGFAANISLAQNDGYEIIESPPVSAEETEDDDVLEEIIANSNKSFAEKMKLIKNFVPDLRAILTKDFAVPVEDDELPSSKSKDDANKPKAPITEKVAVERQAVRQITNEKEPNASEIESDSSTTSEHCPPPRIRGLHVSIPLPNISPVIKLTRKVCEVSHRIVEEVTRINSHKPSEAIHNKISNRRNSIVSSSTPSALESDRNKPVAAAPAKIVARRNTFVPSSTLSTGSTKRTLEIINPPHMMKRRKSVCFIPETPLLSPKAKDQGKWLSKKDQHKHKRRSKDEFNEIKSKLAALVPKDKVIEPKVIRPNTKIPVKNTHKTRSDQLTDTIVKTMGTSSRKHKINEASTPAELCKRARADSGVESAQDKPNQIDSRRTSTAEAKKYAEVKRNGVSERRSTRNHSTTDLNKNKKSTATTKELPIASKAPTATPKDIRRELPKTATSAATSTATPKDRKEEIPKATLKTKKKPTTTSTAISTTTSAVTSTATAEEASAVTTTATDEVTPTVTLTATAEITPAAAPSSPAVKSILKKPCSIQKRRATVTFVEEPRIKTISPNPACAPAPVRREEENVENVDDVIFNIMSLGMNALKASCSATINGKNFAYKPAAHEYESLRHLQNVFVPLMKAELWKEIEDGYARAKNTPATNVQLNYCVRDENYSNRFKYHCETPSPGAIQNGALVMMLGINSGKEFLGYIINRQITNRNCYFQFVTPCSVEATGSTPTLLKLKQIMYIRPNLKVFEALFKLKNSPLIQHILHPRHNYMKPKKHGFTYIGYNELNQDQMITLSTVYRNCIGGQPFISLIEGPPGTGKSRLITNLVLQLLYGKEMVQPLKILVCAPSNAAVDILTKNLIEARKKHTIQKGQKKMKLVRFGVLEKMDVSVRCVSIQDLTSQNEKMVLLEQNKLLECKKKKEAELSTCKVREKINAIRKEIDFIESKIKTVKYDEKCLLEGANVICTTLNSCCALSNKISSMDVCIIDEATQCNEPASLIPLQFGVKSLILVGDTKQLPSTVVSEIAKQYNYDQSLFQRLQKSFESANEFENPISQLTIQYRMHPEILHWPNEYFYRNQLVCNVDADKSTLKLKPYTVFNLNFEQSARSGQKHISNVNEAKFVRNLLDFLLTKAHPKNYSYGVISAYSQQKDDLAKVLSLTYPFVTVNTIDSCQGQERDIVIISIARTRGIGFLAIRQRLNVALTRAKKMLILCGNFNSLQSHPMWTSLLDDARNRKLYVHMPNMDDDALSSYFEKTLTTTDST